MEWPLDYEKFSIVKGNILLKSTLLIQAGQAHTWRYLTSVADKKNVFVPFSVLDYILWIISNWFKKMSYCCLSGSFLVSYTNTFSCLEIPDCRRIDNYDVFEHFNNLSETQPQNIKLIFRAIRLPLKGGNLFTAYQENSNLCTIGYRKLLSFFIWNTLIS